VRVAAGSALVGERRATMDEIVRSRSARDRHHGRDRVRIERASTGIEQVNVAVTQMDEVTQQNAALVEQAAAAAQSLADQADSLKAAVAIFNRVEVAAGGGAGRGSCAHAGTRREAPCSRNRQGRQRTGASRGRGLGDVLSRSAALRMRRVARLR
jgi:methyl-accepting chemotaxis protein